MNYDILIWAMFYLFSVGYNQVIGSVSDEAGDGESRSSKDGLMAAEITTSPSCFGG